MKFTDLVEIKKTLPFEYNGVQLHAKNVTMAEFDRLTERLKNSLNLEVIKDAEEKKRREEEVKETTLYVLRELLLDKDGNPFDEFKEASWEDIQDTLPAAYFQGLLRAILETLSGKSSGN